MPKGSTNRSPTASHSQHKNRLGAWARRNRRQTTQAASAALRRPGFDGVQPDTAARILRAAEAARRAMKANGNLRLALTVCGMEMAAR